MKNFILLLVLAVSLIHCKNTPKQESDGETVAPDNQPALNLEGTMQLRGLLLRNAGRTGFKDYKERMMYEAVDMSNTLDSAYARAVAPCHYLSESVYAVVTGKFRPETKVFEIMRIDTMLAKTPENMTSLGAAFEFWCHGTNPDWDIEIAFEEGGIFYQNPSDNAAWFCPWTLAVKKGDSWVYDVPAGTLTAITGAMVITIKKEKATDGRTDKVYDYSVVVEVGGKKLKGVAVRGIAKVLGPEGAE